MIFFQTRKKLAWYNNLKILSSSRDCKHCHFFGAQTASLPTAHILRAPKTSVTIFLPVRLVDCAHNLFYAVALGKHCYIFRMKGKDFLDYKDNVTQFSTVTTVLSLSCITSDWWEASLQKKKQKTALNCLYWLSFSKYSIIFLVKSLPWHFFLMWTFHLYK